MTENRRSKTNRLDIGAEFEGKYSIVKELGRGGFGMVYLAHQSSMDRYVAIKVLKTGLGDAHHSASERFLREVKIISKLRHPNTVTIHDFGETQSGVLYMVLEYIEGETLEDILEREGAQPPMRALHLSRQVGKSLAEAHKHGVIHRDLKPANIMVTDLETEYDFVKVLDFGVARLLRGQTRDLTSAGLPEGERELIGTPRYMSPEQVRGQSLSAASDIYSLGLILYELLVGQPAVQGDTTMALITQQISPEPLSMPGLRPLRPEIVNLVRNATAKAPENRFQSTERFVANLGETLKQLERSQTAEAQSSDNHIVHNQPLGFAGVSAPDSVTSQAPESQSSGDDGFEIERSPMDMALAADSSGARAEQSAADDLPPSPTDENVFSVQSEADETLEKEGAGQDEEEDLIEFTFDVLKLVFLGLAAFIGVYMSFIITGAIFGEFIGGGLRFWATLVLALAIPLLTALGENSQRERFEVVNDPVDRVARVLLGTAILSFGVAVLVSLAMSGRVVYELRAVPNWFMSSQARQSKIGHFNAKFSDGVARVVEQSTRAVGMYEGPDIGPAQQPMKKKAPIKPPEPTRPATQNLPPKRSRLPESKRHLTKRRPAARPTKRLPASPDGTTNPPPTEKNRRPTHRRQTTVRRTASISGGSRHSLARSGLTTSRASAFSV